MERKNICCETSHIRKALIRLQKLKDDFENHPDAGDELFGLQEELRPEREFLKSFWVKDGEDYTHIPEKRMWLWDANPAFNDMPDEYQYEAKHRLDGKWGIFHTREKYLEDLQWQIWSLFHLWEFATKGWTAY